MNERKQVHLAVQNETFQLRDEGDAAVNPLVPDHIKSVKRSHLRVSRD